MTYAADLEALFGLKNVQFKHNLSKAELFNEAVENDRGRVQEGGPRDAKKCYSTALGADGPLIYYTDPGSTGRRVKDTFAAAYPEFEESVWWKNDFQKFDPEKYEALLGRVVAHLNDKAGTMYVQDVFAGSDPEYAIPFRFVGEYAVHALFVNTMFPKRLEGVPEDRRFTLINCPSFLCEPERDGNREGSNNALIVDLRRRIALICGSNDYCGSNKKTLFTVLNYMLPEMGHLPMHCSANVGKDGDSAILFGLSGTGKTTLSADPQRELIGDDEIGWTDKAISNFEDGCYAKLINLDKKAEPVIAAALSMPCTVIENVPPLPGKAMEDTDPQDLDLDDNSITENTRFAYGLDCNPVVREGSRGPTPKTIVLLTADAFGVLPPVSMLSQEEVMYHFVSGFTSKLAGTEVGVTEPKAAFSACFGAPFMPRHPSVYAELLSAKMKATNARAILLNTGWSGGAYGVGKRISIKHTRGLLDAALRGDLDAVGTEEHPIFGLRMPTSCPDVPTEILNPRNTWDDKEAYDAAAGNLREMFQANFEAKGFGALGIKPVM